MSEFWAKFQTLQLKFAFFFFLQTSKIELQILSLDSEFWQYAYNPWLFSPNFLKCFLRFFYFKLLKGLQKRD